MLRADASNCRLYSAPGWSPRSAPPVDDGRWYPHSHCARRRYHDRATKILAATTRPAIVFRRRLLPDVRRPDRRRGADRARVPPRHRRDGAAGAAIVRSRASGPPSGGVLALVDAAPPRRTRSGANLAAPLLVGAFVHSRRRPRRRTVLILREQLHVRARFYTGMVPGSLRRIGANHATRRDGRLACKRCVSTLAIASRWSALRAFPHHASRSLAKTAPTFAASSSLERRHEPTSPRDAGHLADRRIALLKQARTSATPGTLTALSAISSPARLTRVAGTADYERQPRLRDGC